MTNKNIKGFNQLQELSGSDYKMADGEPNIKGWEVRDELGKRIGNVKELLFNPSSRLVRYIILTPENKTAQAHVLIPIGFADLHEKDDVVVLTAVTADQVALLPAYTDVHVSPSTESEIRRILNGQATTTEDAHNEAFYDHDHFNTDRLYSRRK